jgi:hypothetical protein
MRPLCCLAAAIGALLLGAFPAIAAVRSCKPLVIGAAREAADELTAKKLALESWLGLAQQSGAGYTRWQLADRRALNCRPLPVGGFQCQAAGAPCTILQTPGTPPPPGSGPKSPGGKGIST